MIYAIATLAVAAIGFLIWWGVRERRAGGNAVVVKAQKDVINEQAKINAARVATADPSSDRAERLRDRFTRK
jgi:Flp pilus assembly protein TadB